jgi:hypothetical protein
LRALWRREAVSLAAGFGNSARVKTECRRHSVSRRHPIGKRPSRVILLRVRTTRLSIRLAYRSMGQRPQQARHLALRMRHRMAVLERAKRTGAAATTASGTPLLPNGRSPVEERGGRPSRAALSRLERASGCALRGLAELLGPTEPADHQSGRSHAEIRRRGARSKHQAFADGWGFRNQRGLRAHCAIADVAKRPQISSTRCRKDG